MAAQPDYPVDDVYQILRACNAAEPLQPGDTRWHDFTRLRHAPFVTRLQRLFRVEPGERGFHHRLIYGHRGCGKSTDLLRFKQWADQNGFFAERTEVNVHFGLVELEFSDMYLLAATVAESALDELNKPLPKEAIKPIVEWFAEVTREDRQERSSELSAEAGGQVGGSLPFGLGKLFAKFTAATKAGSSHARIVREQMRKYPQQLIDRTNSLLKQANRHLADLGRGRGLIVVFDNLDRYPPAQIIELLIRGSSLFEHLGCHALYTIPINLAFEPGPVPDVFGPPINVLMMSLRRQGDFWRQTVKASPYDEDAVNEMLEALRKRVNVEKLFEDPADAPKLVKFSGGCIRDLMHLVTLSFEMSEGDRLTSAGVNEAVDELRARYAQ